MPAFSTLLRLLLVLALVASGTAGAWAPAMDPAAEKAVLESAPPCHETATEEPDAGESATGVGCCDEGFCGCDCLHPPPPMVVGGYKLTALPDAGLRMGGMVRKPPGAAACPDIRPPIA
jgi:hypothetical protein